jgi:hypothetical protein
MTSLLILGLLAGIVGSACFGLALIPPYNLLGPASAGTVFCFAVWGACLWGMA